MITLADRRFGMDRSTQRSLFDEQGNVWLVTAEAGEATLLSFPGLGDFVVDLAASHVTCWLGHADAAGARHALLDHVVPRLLVATGSTVLHACAVVAEQGAVLFAGPSGAGKSTLAARCASLGAPVLADDATLVEHVDGRWTARPSYPGLRLWQDSIGLAGPMGEVTPVSTGSPKSRIGVPAAPAVDHRVAAIVRVERRPGPVTAARLVGTQAFSALWGTVFAWPGSAMDQGLLDRVTALAIDAIVLSVGFADSASVQEILDAVASLAGER